MFSMVPFSPAPARPPENPSAFVPAHLPTSRWLPGDDPDHRHGRVGGAGDQPTKGRLPVQPQWL